MGHEGDPGDDSTSHLDQRQRMEWSGLRASLLTPALHWTVAQLVERPLNMHKSPGFDPQHSINQGLGHRPVVLALGRWRQGDREFKVIYAAWATAAMTMASIYPVLIESSEGRSKRNCLPKSCGPRLNKPPCVRT